MVVIGEPGKAVVSELLPSDHELIESLGGTEVILRQFKEHRERRQRLAAMAPGLTEKYPDQRGRPYVEGLLRVPRAGRCRAGIFPG